MADEKKIVIELRNVAGETSSQKAFDNSETERNVELTDILKSLMQQEAHQQLSMQRIVSMNTLFFSLIIYSLCRQVSRTI